MHANLHIQTISRGSRKSAVAASAYRSGSSVVDKIPQPKQGQKVTHLEKRGYSTQWSKKVDKVKQINQAKAGHQKYIRTYSGLGGNNQKHATLPEAIRQDVAKSYYDSMYGDGTEGSYDRKIQKRTLSAFGKKSG